MWNSPKKAAMTNRPSQLQYSRSCTNVFFFLFCFFFALVLSFCARGIPNHRGCIGRMYNVKRASSVGLWYLSHRRPAKAQASLRNRAVSPEPSLFARMKKTKGPTKNQTASPTGWLRMHVWRMSLQRRKSTVISWHGSIIVCLWCVVAVGAVTHALSSFQNAKHFYDDVQHIFSKMDQHIHHFMCRICQLW